MTDYMLCSSSSEQGEVLPQKINNKPIRVTSSVLHTFYYPNTSVYIGPNSLIRVTDFTAVKPFSKIKNFLASEFHHIYKCVPLTNDEAFFKNSFKAISLAEPVTLAYELLELNSTQETDTKPIKRRKGSSENLDKFKAAFNYQIELFNLVTAPVKDRYDTFCGDFLFHDRKQSFFKLNTSQFAKIVVVSDSILDKLNNTNVYTFFRVSRTDEKVSYIFEECYFKSIAFYEYLDLYAEQVMMSKMCNEYRAYKHGSLLVLIYSSTVFGNFRLFPTINDVSNVKTIVNKSCVGIVPYRRELKGMEWIMGLDLATGDYAINNRVIYEVSVDGKKVQFTGINYQDLIKESA